MNEWAQATIDHDVFPTQYKTNIKIGNSLIMKQVIMKLEPQGWVPNTKFSFENQFWHDFCQYRSPFSHPSRRFSLEVFNSTQKVPNY